MTGRAGTLIHELWEEEDGCTMVCDAGPRGDAARALLEPRARLAWVFEAASYFEAMTQYYKRMEWGDYSTDQPWDRQPYPEEWIVQQREVLARLKGEREVIASCRSGQAWREAAADLGVRFESPFAMSLRDATYWCAGLLPDFGGPLGAVIVSRESHDHVSDFAEELGFFASGLNPYFYEVYDRSTFVETLNDWGWFGDPADRPPWFAGAIGRHGGDR